MDANVRYHRAKANLNARWAEEYAAKEEAKLQALAEAERQRQTAIRTAEITANLDETIKGDTNMNDDKLQEIVQKYAAQARAEIERETAKSEAQQKLEAAQRRQEKVAQEYAALAKDASRNAPRLDQLGKEIKAIEQEISIHGSAFAYQQAQEEQARLEEQDRNTPRKDWKPAGQLFVPQIGNE